MPLILLVLLQLPNNVLANNGTKAPTEDNLESVNTKKATSNAPKESKNNTDTLTIHLNDKLLPLGEVPKNSSVTVEIDTGTGKYQIIEKSNDKKSVASNNSISFFGTYVPIALVSAGISAVITFIMYFLNRKNAKKQIKFDLALKNLLPEVYVPLLTELREHELNNKEIDSYKVKKLILENMVMLDFAPNELKKDINEIFIICNQVRSQKNYSSKEEELVRILKQVEKNITKRFGALKG